MSRNPEFTELLKRMQETHDKKSHDYAQDSNVFSNFEYAAKVSEPFKDPVDRVFATMIGIKLARLAELLNGKTPKNESVEDTFLDGPNYFAIWGSMHMKRMKELGVEKGSKASCTCDHPSDFHILLQSGYRGSCRQVDCTCTHFLSKYDHLGNLIIVTK